MSVHRSPDSPGPPLLRIGELSRRTGVSPDTLRAWERRYGLLEPARSEGGFRLYGEADEARVRTMKSLLGSGISASEAARGALAAPAPIGAPAQAPGPLADRLRDALERYDEAAANAVLDEAVGSLSIESLAASVALPTLEEIGARWSRGEVSVAQEHFASNLLRGRLLGLARGWGGGAGPLALLACPPGELHDLGLIAFGLALRSHGWRITYLGPDTPVETVTEAAARLEPALVVLAALGPERFEAAAEAIAALGSRHPVALGGSGSGAELAERLGARALTAGPIEAAASVAGASAPA
ncbi:MAG TPA: MerR family transcriptional regulator [Solirubrobacterales bacterium]